MYQACYKCFNHTFAVLARTNQEIYLKKVRGQPIACGSTTAPKRTKLWVDPFSFLGSSRQAITRRGAEEWASKVQVAGRPSMTYRHKLGPSTGRILACVAADC